MKNYLLALFIFIASCLSAQFITDQPVVISENVADATYVLPHIATADSGFYVSWYDESAGYTMYLQFIDPLGNAVWPEPALVTDYPQDSWISDYSLVSDGDNAYIVFSDARNGDTDKDIFAYKFNAQGESLWGVAGVELVVADTDYDLEAAPKATVMGNGDIVFAWSKNDAAGYTVDMQWLSPEGVRKWESGNLISETGFRIFEPNLVAAGDSLVYLIYIHQDGMYGDRQIHVQLIDETGSNIWDSPVIVTLDSGIGMGRTFKVHPSSNNGLYVTWYGDPDFNSANDVFTQHVSIDGALAFADNGLNLSVNDNMNQTTPFCVGENEEGDAVYMWQEVNSNNTQKVVKTQLVNPSGELLFGNAAKIISDSHILLGKGGYKYGQLFVPASIDQGNPLEMLVYNFSTDVVTTTEMNMGFEEMSSFGNGQFVVVDLDIDEEISEVRVQNFTHRAQVGAEAVLHEAGLESFAGIADYHPDSLFYYLEMDRSLLDEFLRPMNIYQTVSLLDEPIDDLGNYRVKVEAANGDFRFYQFSLVEYALADILDVESGMYFVHVDNENKVLYVEMQVIKPDSNVDLVLSPGARLRIDNNWDYDYSILNYKIDSLLGDFRADTSYMDFEIVDYIGHSTDWILAFVVGSGAITDGVFAGRIYPNPSSDQLFIESPAFIDEITFISLQGKIQKIVTPQASSVCIDITSLPIASYMVKVMQGNRITYSTFIKK